MFFDIIVITETQNGNARKRQNIEPSHLVILFLNKVIHGLNECHYTD